jgi:gluconate 2-dehydrogenase gamma chain
MNDKNKISSDETEKSASLSRRDLLKGVGLSGAALMSGCSPSVISPSASAQTGSPRIPVVEAFETLTAAESAALDALASRILPSDDGSPGAHEARAVHFIDRGLTGAMAASREQYALGLAALDAHAMEVSGNAFHRLAAPTQDAIIDAMTRNAIPNFPMLNAGFFNTVRTHTIEGSFSDPYYGGNRDFVGWDLIGYPGVRAVSTAEDIRLGRGLAPSRQSAYNMPSYTKDLADSATAQQTGASHEH